MSVVRILLLLGEMILLLLIGKRAKDTGYFFKGIQAGIIAYYTVFPLILNVFYLFGSDETIVSILNGKSLSLIVSADIFNMLLSFVIVLLFDVLFVFAYTSKTQFVFGTAYSRKVERKMKITSSRTLAIFGDICFIIGGISVLGYVFAFGSISRALALAGYIRSFDVSVTNYISYYASLLIIPAGLVVVSPWCYLVSADYTGSHWRKFKFIASYLCGLLFLAVKAGRAPMLLYLIALVMPILKKRFKHPWILLIIGAFICLPVLDLMDQIFDGTSSADVGYNFVHYLSQFMYPYRTSLSMFDIVHQFGLRFGQDFVTPFIGLLPGLEFDATWRIVSEFYSGKSWVSSGSTPTDLITFCIMQFHVLGILLGGVLGWIIRNLDYSINAYQNSKYKFSDYGIHAMGSFSLLNSFWYVSTADFESFVRNLYFLMICIVLIITTTKMEREIYDYYENTV